MKLPPHLYFSFRSPYSWLALHRLRERVPDARTRIEFIPYWDPDPLTEQALAERGGEFHYVQMSRAKHRYLLHDTKRIAQRFGLPMRWPIDVDPWWEVPHLAFLKASAQGTGFVLFDAITAARWERGENVCEPEVLAAVADQAGLDGADLASATEDPDIRARGVECLMRAYEDDIFGIPYFRAGRERFWGLDRLDEFITALPGDKASTVDSAVPVAVGYDADTAGGCG